MKFSVSKCYDGKISIQRLGKEIEVSNGDSLLILSDNIKGYGNVLIVKKITEEKVKQLIGDE